MLDQTKEVFEFSTQSLRNEFVLTHERAPAASQLEQSVLTAANLVVRSGTAVPGSMDALPILNYGVGTVLQA